MSQSYFKEIEENWRKAVKIVSKEKHREWKKKSVYFDCSNGVGAISLQNYSFLSDFFRIEKVYSEDFDCPNVNCGAEYLYHNRLQLSSLKLPEAEHYVWLDGDADRILMKYR